MSETADRILEIAAAGTVNTTVFLKWICVTQHLGPVSPKLS